jgi:hypothetical protein
VLVNLRLDTEETRRRGVELHVCEVQLMLRAFADIKASLPVCNDSAQGGGWESAERDEERTHAADAPIRNICALPPMGIKALARGELLGGRLL